MQNITLMLGSHYMPQRLFTKTRNLFRVHRAPGTKILHKDVIPQGARHEQQQCCDTVFVEVGGRLQCISAT